MHAYIHTQIVTTYTYRGRGTIYISISTEGSGMPTTRPQTGRRITVYVYYTQTGLLIQKPDLAYT